MKKKNPCDTAILQAQIVQLKLREPKPKETKHRKWKFVHENKIQGQLEISQHEELLVLSNDLNKNTLGVKVQNLGAMYWNFITRAPTTLFIVKNFLMLSFTRSTAVKDQVWKGGCRPSWVDPMAGIYWNVSILVFVLLFYNSCFHLDLFLFLIHILWCVVVFQFNDSREFYVMGSPTPFAIDLVFLQFPDGLDFNLSNTPFEIPLWNKYDENWMIAIMSLCKSILFDDGVFIVFFCYQFANQEGFEFKLTQRQHESYKDFYLSEFVYGFQESGVSNLHRKYNTSR